MCFGENARWHDIPGLMRWASSIVSQVKHLNRPAILRIKRGVLVPIEVTSGRMILDGRTRWKAAKRLGIRRVPVVSAPVNDTLPKLPWSSRRTEVNSVQYAVLPAR
jgi:hypothetical protein